MTQIFNSYLMSQSVSKVFELFGYPGEVTIKKERNTKECLVYHSAFEEPFVGYFPMIDERFTVELVDHTVRHPDEDFPRLYKEAFVFDTYSYEPLFYSIYVQPEYQRLVLSDNLLTFKKGDLVYSNACMQAGYKQYILGKPIFKSEMFKLDKVIRKLKRQANA